MREPVRLTMRPEIADAIRNSLNAREQADVRSGSRLQGRRALHPLQDSNLRRWLRETREASAQGRRPQLFCAAEPGNRRFIP
jgi:hypothetical protein